MERTRSNPRLPIRWARSYHWRRQGTGGAISVYVILQSVAVGAGLLLLAATALPFLPTREKWVRIWDFPRTQIAGLLAAALALALLTLPGHPLALVFILALLAALAWQFLQIWPFTPLHSVQAQAVPRCREDDEIKLLVANVKRDNPKKDAVLALVERMRPDVVLLLETDSAWDQALAPMARAYRNALRRPKENTYGLHLFSNLELIDPQVRHLIDPEIPSIKTAMKLRSGESVFLYGLHPRPPPRADTAERDAELVRVGLEVRRHDEPAIVLGDMNDVAWSRTTRLFQEVSGLLDPRIGRGLYATFHAKWRLLRWPLDHVFFSNVFALRTLAVLPSIGSDHFPLFVSLCFRPAVSVRQSEPKPEASDLARAQRTLRDGRNAQREEA